MTVATIERETEQQLKPITRLTSDLRKATVTLTPDEARFLVDAYYMMQDQRVRSGNQVLALSKSGEPHEVLRWFHDESESLETSVRNALNAYAKSQDVGQWALGVCGIGPVIAAGLLAHINCAVPTVGHVWRFAGLDPSLKWNKGEKRPFNATLKTLCWKIGESFVKVKSRESDVYGKLYEQRRAAEHETNDAGGYANQAAAMLERTPTHKQRAHYAEGKLPVGHIHMRAKRYAVKMFLSHYHAVGHFCLTGAIPPKPYAIGILKHAHIVNPPNMDAIDGFADAWAMATDTMSHSPG